MHARPPGSQDIIAGAVGLLLGGPAGLTGGLFGLTGPVPAILLGLITAMAAIELEHTRDPQDMRNVGIGALVGGAAGAVAMALAHEPLAHALPLAANYLLMGALAGAWFRQARLGTVLGALAGVGLGAWLAAVAGRLQAGHTGTTITGPLAVALQAALGAVTGGMAGAWLWRAARRAENTEQSSITTRPVRGTMNPDEACNPNRSDNSAGGADSDPGRL